jgi:hypothetical protein
MVTTPMLVPPLDHVLLPSAYEIMLQFIFFVSLLRHVAA